MTLRCFYCDVILDGRLVPSRWHPGQLVSTRPVSDHVVPRCQAGTVTVTACGECNQAKGVDSAEEFIARGLMPRSIWRITVPCPTCNAEAGKRCVSARGRHRTNLHPARVPEVVVA